MLVKDLYITKVPEQIHFSDEYMSFKNRMHSFIKWERN